MSSALSQPETPIPSNIVAELTPAFSRLRAAVRSALDTRPRAAYGARACAREFAFDKSIGWKIFQIGYGAEVEGALSAIPGARGWEIVLAKFTAARVPEQAVHEISLALAAFEARLTERRIDRSMLASMAAAVEGGDESRRQMQRLRKQASDSMAVILGVQSSSRIGCYVVAPSASPGMADLAALTVADGLERRRPGSPWPLYTPIATVDAAGRPVKHDVTALVPDARTPVVEECSSAGVSAAEIAPAEGGAFMFHDRDPARSDALCVSFAEVAKAVGPVVRTGDESICELSMPITMPTEVAVLDVLVHRDIGRHGEIHAELRAAGACSRTSRAGSAKDLPAIPLDDGPSEVTDLRVAEASAAANTRYGELRRRAASRLGHSFTDFVCHRVVLSHPPVPCLLTIWWELASSI